ncbi:MAG TPA: PAS domain-containing protein [Arenibacter sp.]|nr:PAS domain-containing protein [Arenibacter sp.]
MLRNTPTTTNQFLIKQLPKATAFINMDFNVALASDKWADVLNMETTEITHKNIQDLLPTMSDKLNENLQACFHGKFPGPCIETYIDFNHRTKWLEWTNIPWFDENENIIGAILQTEDVTDRINSEQKIEKLEFILKETVEVGKIGSWEYNQLQDSLNCCPMIRNITEVDDDYEFTMDNSVNFYKVGYNRNTISMAIYSAIENKRSWNESLQIITAKGKEKWVNVSGKPLYNNGNYIGLIGTIQDITDYILTEQRTKHSEHLLKTLINNLPIHIYIKDTESRKLLVNRPELEFCGIANENDLIGKDDFDVFDKITAQRFREEDMEVMVSQNPMLNKEITLDKPDGSKSTYLSSKIPLKGTNGETSGLVGITMDISELKQKEKELKKLISVTSLQNKKLVSFAHIVSHNLRSHSANFSMLLNFLNTEEDEGEKTKIVRMLSEASNELMETLHNLNEIVAINTESVINKKNVDLNREVNNVLRDLADVLDKNRATVITEIPKDTHIHVIPDYLESILFHIITNAIKYKKPGVDPIIKFGLTYVQNYTVLSIEDNGMGIDLMKYGKKLFGMYKSFHGNLDAKGLGLYIVKNKIEAMEGKINAKSQVGVGTTFNLYFNEEN